MEVKEFRSSLGEYGTRGGRPAGTDGGRRGVTRVGPVGESGLVKFFFKVLDLKDNR